MDDRGIEVVSVPQDGGGVASAISEDPEFGQSTTLTATGSWQRHWIQAAAVLPTLLPWAIIVGCSIAVAGWMLDRYVIAGHFAAVPGFRVVTGAGCVLLAICVLLMRTGKPESLRPVARGLAALAGLIALFVIANGAGIGPEIDWNGTGPLREPSVFGALVMLTLAVGLITIDLDPPRYRWPDVIMPLSGFLLLFAIIVSSYRLDFFGSEDKGLSLSLTLATVLTGLFFSYVSLRRDRGVPGFLLAEGPGPSMARILIPTALAIPFFVALIDWGLASLDIANEVARRSTELVLIVSGLVAVVTISSRRLQAFYDDWRVANAALVEQSGVVRDMAEGVALIRGSDGQFVLTNPQFASMHGYDGDELIGKHFDILRPSNMSEAEIETWNSVEAQLIQELTASYENRALRKDGREIWCRTNASLMEHPVYGQVVNLVKSDITEERRARIAQNKAESKFKEVFEASPIGLCMVNDDLTFDRVNPAFERITGYGQEELRTMTFLDITHPDDMAMDLENSQAFFNGDSPGFEMEKRYIHKDGTIIWTALTVSRMPGDGSGRVTALSIVEDITDRRELDQRVQHMADHDALTGLFNRRRFEEELEVTVASKAMLKEGIAVLVVDIDNFKFVNDTYGHSVGDQVIIRVAEALDERIRSTDTVARLGGDEFVIILRGIDRQSSLSTAEDLVELIRDEVRVDGPDFSARVTASIGLTMANPYDDVDDETLLLQADKAMYSAKDGGRNRARMFDPEVSDDIGQSFGWVERIRSALANDEFELFAQPIIDFEGLERPLYEVFLRMRASDGSLIAPGAFLPVAERHDLIQSIDAWVFSEAITMLATRGGPDARFGVCVNLSGRSVGDPRLVDLISSRLRETGVDPSRLVFEVTETSAIGNIAQAQDFASTLAEFGCRFALDDFGTGFASFYYLKHIVCDYLKIDGEFVRRLVEDETNRLVVKALVDIATGMGKKTIAEQIEDGPTLNLLKEYGVDFAQGYYLARPAPLDDIDFTAIPALPAITST